MPLSPQKARERFYQVVWPHRAMLLRMAFILSGRQADAEDLAQETMLKAFRSIEQFRDGTEAAAWLMTILRNTRIDRLRQLQRQQPTVNLDGLDETIEADEEPAVEEGWERPQELLESFSDQRMIDALAALPEEIRWTLLLVDVQQLDQKDAAEMLAVPVGTIKSRLHRGRAMLRAALASTACSRGLPTADRTQESPATGEQKSEVH